MNPRRTIDNNVKMAKYQLRRMVARKSYDEAQQYQIKQIQTYIENIEVANDFHPQVALNLPGFKNE